MTTNTRTQIVATIGPASGEPETLLAMSRNGMDVARLNLAWGPAEEHLRFIARIREAAKKDNRTIPIICDLAGPRVQEAEGHHFGTGTILTEKDRDDIALGVREHVEYFAQSYVGDAEDIQVLRAVLTQEHSTAKIIAKIERQKALDNIDDILSASDAIMVARGDLGNEVPLEQIPFIEQTLIEKAHEYHKPVIVATDMMPSMIEGDHPTRSDVTDVAFAVIYKADAVMLSNETAIGKHPIEVITMMDHVVAEAEKHETARQHFLL